MSESSLLFWKVLAGACVHKSPLAHIKHSLFSKSKSALRGRATSKAKGLLHPSDRRYNISVVSQKEKPLRRINRRTWSLARFRVLFVTLLIVPRRLRQGGGKRRRTDVVSDSTDHPHTRTYFARLFSFQVAAAVSWLAGFL